VPITVLGSGIFCAQLAAELGVPFAFGAQIQPQYLYAAAEHYHTHFQPSEVLRKPYLMIAIPMIAAKTDAIAQRLFTTSQ
jgi:alkanesulfonate monooxygenase SsuD/methylene tetrahydromethanopterin reductase-like flavin-dependent oxidoreductase (luciferase family)